MRATYDADVDILYVTLTENLVEYTEDVSRQRQYQRGIDFSADGAVVGYEFMNASRAIDLEGPPHRAQLAALLKRTSGLRVLQSK